MSTSNAASNGWKEETDSVDAWAAGEYSEDTLSLVRGYQKPDWLDEPSSLDPVEDIEDHALNNLRLPPRTYDAMKEAVAEEAAELRAVKGFEADPQLQSLVDLRHRLSKGTSLDEIKLLKLRAYHRGVEERRAAAKAEAEAEMKARMQDYKVPLDAIPEELINLTPEQLGVQWLKANRSLENGGGVETREASEIESEWAPGWNSAQSYLSSAASREGILQSILQPFVSHYNRRGENVDKSDGDEGMDSTKGGGSLGLYGDPDRYQQWQPYHEYTPGYLRQQEIHKRVTAQRVQRSLAFWIPLVAALGASLLRRITKRGKKQGKRQGARS